jgi:SAM-dependent MidA family methyltransferase
VIARALDRWWDELGRPDPFVVVEAGAGTGTLAATVLAAAPACAPALRYVMAERSPALRAEQRARLALEAPAFVLGPTDHPDDEEARPLPGQGPLVTALPELPAVAFEGVVIANELLDNLGFRLVERGDDGWLEVRVGNEGGRLAEVLVPAPDELAAEASRLVPHATPGARLPLQRQAEEFLRSALAVVRRGRVVVVDYADATPSLAARPWLDWVRTYRAHGRGGHPLETPGRADITCEVALDQLARVAAPATVATQADFLAEHGMGALEAEAAAAWQAGAARGDLEALRARSRVGEARALSDAAGLGAFTVAEWVTGRRAGSRTGQ